MNGDAKAAAFIGWLAGIAPFAAFVMWAYNAPLVFSLMATGGAVGMALSLIALLLAK